MSSEPTEIEQSINDFVQLNGTKAKDLGPLMSVLKDIANAGTTKYVWPKLVALIRVQLQNVIDQYDADGCGECPDLFGESFEVRYCRVQKQLEDFEEPPFTLQRMCELLTAPKRYYRNKDKFFHSFSKTVFGISYPNERHDGEENGDIALNHNSRTHKIKNEEGASQPSKKRRLETTEEGQEISETDKDKTLTLNATNKINEAITKNETTAALKE